MKFIKKTIVDGFRFLVAGASGLMFALCFVILTYANKKEMEDIDYSEIDFEE